MSPPLYVLDGHDGSGKTTLARMLAAHLGAVMVRPYTGDVARRFVALHDQGRLRELHDFTLGVVRRHEAARAYARAVVFDRHWLTMWSLLPEELQAEWEPLPPTVMAWADPETTFARVTARGETARNTLAYHQRYCAVFADLAARCRLPVVDTTGASPDAAFRRVLEAFGLPAERPAAP